MEFQRLRDNLHSVIFAVTAILQVSRAITSSLSRLLPADTALVCRPGHKYDGGMQQKTSDVLRVGLVCRRAALETASDTATAVRQRVRGLRQHELIIIMTTKAEILHRQITTGRKHLHSLRTELNLLYRTGI